MMRKFMFLGVLALASASVCSAQTMPGTVGETLSGKKLAPADAVRGHEALLIVGFSKAAGDRCGEWAKAARRDSSMAGVTVLQVAELEAAPGFVRGMIKGAMRKGMSAAEQDSFVVLTQDDKVWRSYFGVSDDKDAYVELLNADGTVLWHGHGAAADLEPLVRAVRK